MRTRIAVVLLLTVAWVALWADLSVGNVLAGMAIGSIITWAAPPPATGVGAFRPVAAVRFAAHFLWQLVKASGEVAWEVVTPENRENAGIVGIPIRGVSSLLTTVVADAISLTPGTVTLSVREDPTVLTVHVLHLDDLERMRREVLHLEELVIKAFGSDEALAQLDDPFDPRTPGGARPREGGPT